jgi:myo-inositol-1(or 4)-monophosphatase
MEPDLLDAAVAACRLGAEVLTRSFRDGALEVREKGENDFVTAADHASEAAIVAEIRRRFPHHRILAEEGGGGEAGESSEFEWLIDPLDGTTNFLHGLPVFCVSVACRRGGELLAGAVLDPAGDNLFTARRGGGASWNGRPMRVSERPGLAGAFLATGFPFRAHRTLDVYLALFRDVFCRAKAIRRCGSAALDLAYTAAGVFDGFFEFRLSPWDIGAGVLLVEEAGGRVTDFTGTVRDASTRYDVVASNGGVHDELVAATHMRFP